MKPILFNPFTPARSLFPALFAVSGLLVSALPAITIDKADNALDLNLPASWAGDIVPDSTNIASWNDSVTTANSTLLGANLAWKGIEITNPGGTVTIGGANTLTLGSAGIKLSEATQNLDINTNLTLAQGEQTWNLAADRVLNLGAGAFSRSAGAVLTIDGAGSVTSGMTGLSNVNSILGPWALTGSGTDVRYATLTAGVIAPYTGATALSGVAGVFGGMPSGGTGTVNYDVSGTGTFAVYGLSRNINTLRYTGGGATQQSNTSADLLTLNGILNAGTGTLNIGGGGFALRVTIGSSNNLVLAAESANITLANEIKNGVSPGSVTIQGSAANAVTLAGPNTYTGGTFVSSGRLFAGSNAMNGGPVHVSEGATLTFIGNNQTSSSRLTGQGAILNDTANTVVFTGDHSGFAGSFTHNAAANNTQFNSAISGSKDAAYTLDAGELIFAGAGDYTVPFGSLSSNAGNIRGGNAASGTTTLEVGKLNTDSTLSGNLNNGATKVIALTKVGAGTLTISGTNSYSGLTTVSAGTLRVEGSISASSSISNDAHLIFEPIGDYTYPNPLTGSGTFTLTGGGSLNLTGNNNFAGDTAIDAGSLRLRGSFGAVSIANDWFNLIGPATGAVFTAASLSFAGEAVLSLPLSGPGEEARVTVTGPLTTTPENGQVVIDIPSFTVSNGTYNLVNFGSLAGGLADFQLSIPGLNARQSGNLFVSGSTLALQVNGDTPKWTGLDGSSWTVGSTGSSSNWQLVAGGTPTNFLNDDDVLFDDSATGTTTVNINNGDVSPRMMVFNNSSKNYTLDGASFGILSGAMSKAGTGSLTINSDNLFDGGLVFESGTLNINSATAIGTGLFTISPGLAKVIDNSSGTALTNAHPNSQSWLDDFTFAGSEDLDLGTGTVTAGGDDSNRTVTVNASTLTIGELKAPSHGLVKAGAGTLVLTSNGAGAAASVLAGTLDVAAGALQLNRPGTDADNSGDLTATGLAGSGSISNGADVERRLILQNTVDHTFAGTLSDGGSGRLGFSKQGSGSLTLTSASSHSGVNEIGFNGAGMRVGVIRAQATQALGTGMLNIGFGGNEATAKLELDGGISLSNPVTIAARNTTTTAIQSIDGNNTLSGTLSITVGGVNNIIQSDAGTLTFSAATAIDNTTNAARLVTFQGDGNIDVSGAIENGTAGGSLGVIKTGIGTLTFNGPNTYTGDTTVAAGTLAIANPVLADTAAVRISFEGTLHLSHGTADTVDRLFIDGDEQAPGSWGGLASSATYKTALITGTGILNVANGVIPPSGYGTWAAATGLTPGVNDASTFDADSDGFDNGTEYILGGLPRDGANNPKIYSLLADSSADADSDDELITTIAVPVDTPAFSAGAPESTATLEGYVITVRGSTDLVTFPVVVTPVNPITTGLPPAPVQGGITYEYRSFSLSGSNGLATKGFLQVTVTHP